MYVCALCERVRAYGRAYVYMYMCVCACMYVCERVCARACVRVYMCAYELVYIRKPYVRMRTYVFMRVCVCVCLFVCLLRASVLYVYASVHVCARVQGVFSLAQTHFKLQRPLQRQTPYSDPHIHPPDLPPHVSTPSTPHTHPSGPGPGVMLREQYRCSGVDTTRVTTHAVISSTPGRTRSGVKSTSTGPSVVGLAPPTKQY